MPTLIVLQGGPATGKTTLCQRLRKDLQVPILAKDDIKEFLFDAVGLPRDRDSSKVYGAATFEALYAVADELLKTHKVLIIEGAFHNERANPRIAAIAKHHDATLVQIYCSAPLAVRRRRFNERIAHSRHAGHHDATLLDTSGLERSERTQGPLSISHTISYNSDREDDLEYIRVQNYIKSILKANYETTD